LGYWRLLVLAFCKREKRKAPQPDPGANPMRVTAWLSVRLLGLDGWPEGQPELAEGLTV
jgi:hypothetical protein